MTDPDDKHDTVAADTNAEDNLAGYRRHLRRSRDELVSSLEISERERESLRAQVARLETQLEQFKCSECGGTGSINQRTLDGITSECRAGCQSCGGTGLLQAKLEAELTGLSQFGLLKIQNISCSNKKAGARE